MFPDADEVKGKTAKAMPPYLTAVAFSYRQTLNDSKPDTSSAPHFLKRCPKPEALSFVAPTSSSVAAALVEPWRVHLDRPEPHCHCPTLLHVCTAPVAFHSDFAEQRSRSRSAPQVLASNPCRPTRFPVSTSRRLLPSRPIVHVQISKIVVCRRVCTYAFSGYQGRRT
jgi:hypothetical protein